MPKISKKAWEAKIKKIPYPRNLEPGETVWIRKGIGGWRIGSEFGLNAVSGGPFVVLKVRERKINTPLVTVREKVWGLESQLCASLLSRQKRRT